MPVREIDGFEVWSSASQAGDGAYWGEISTKPLDGSADAKIFRIPTQRKLNSLREAQIVGADAVAALEKVDTSGIPAPIIDPTRD